LNPQNGYRWRKSDSAASKSRFYWEQTSIVQHWDDHVRHSANNDDNGSGFTANEKHAEEFWPQQERMGPVAAALPGFVAVTDGPIARSPWLYFCGKWQTPDLMDQKPMMQAAYDRWFGACYIRKWRLPEADEKIVGPVFCETAIACHELAPPDKVERLLDRITEAIIDLNPMPFDTLGSV
jgi:hypothetical protein